MSNKVKAIGVIIAIFGALAFNGTLDRLTGNEKITLGSITIHIPNFLNSLKAFVGEIIVMVIGVTILLIGIKICSSSKR